MPIFWNLQWFACQYSGNRRLIVLYLPTALYTKFVAMRNLVKNCNLGYVNDLCNSFPTDANRNGTLFNIEFWTN